MISRLLKARPYGGGPLFDRVSVVRFDLEDISLELAIPASGQQWVNPPRSLNFPFNTPGWFEVNSKRPNMRAWTHVHTSIWYYFPVRLKRLVNILTMGVNEPIGEISMGIHLVKLQGDKKLDLINSYSLADYIKWEYDDYYESAEIGDYGKGMNFEYREKYGRLLAEKGEGYRQQFEAGLKNHLEPTPSCFELLNFGGGLWTSFRLDRGWHESVQYYCFPLSESYYLHINIARVFHSGDKVKALLEPAMNSAAEWLRQHLKITLPGKHAGALALPH